MRLRIEWWAPLAAIVFREVNAGAGANVKACVYLSQKPTEEYTISWKAGSASDHCMYNTGNDATMHVKDGGLTCTSVGYVEHKASSSGGDLCATDQSVWGLSYHGGRNNVSSGSTLTYWEAAGAFLSKGHVWLVNQSKGTKICPSESNCDAGDIWWKIRDTPDIYIVFVPSASASELGENPDLDDLTVQDGELR
ncbi:hypothetical protein G647_02267 [Cladophialophora carrionii CBS 160.54]|uniref:Ig-like domain-containing protein n=1 Tax=Cladophialophora carrionii CBS 160.54 TaxID=1279043 RepID=V9DF32_9EURO|nr:uncharacterized protein G647_02267 [Cladophialophora carrionii CBS 160.54]ETI25494.1 hypothetical protein G647_02267 [Cladophialophora carrionii CBS 160.54]